MTLKELLTGLPVLNVQGDDSLEVTGLAYSSKSVKPGFLFAALRGGLRDGLDFVEEARRAGAAAVLADRPKPADFKGVWVEVFDAREALALCADNFYGQPTKELKVIGITGTKGKTTTSYLIEEILKAAGQKPGVIGTISYRGPQFDVPADRTTPEAPDLQRMLRQILDQGGTHCLIEVSSHSLELKRVWGIRFDAAVFTNLSGEHMDYHASMDDYFEAKKKLFFLNSKKRTAAVNIDDPYGQKLIAELPMTTISYGTSASAIVRAASFTFDYSGISLNVDYPGGKAVLTSPLMGKHNVYNILAAVATSLALNIPWTAIQQGIKTLKGVPGRMEKVDNNQGLHVFVDYAHTDNALRHLLETARSLNPSRVLLVFGAGGDRDRSKRERMGEVAAALADEVILTSDNPRSEDPLAIIAEIEAGMKISGFGRYTVVPDRREAIIRIVTLAKKGDMILVAGKGHENYQEVKGRKSPFSDAAVLREALEAQGNENHG
jgi:UDP-N-acetylmuramoyl-L-alanyl-D-glutamate--2,6-diaminopimelate ligase